MTLVFTTHLTHSPLWLQGLGPSRGKAASHHPQRLAHEEEQPLHKASPCLPLPGPQPHLRSTFLWVRSAAAAHPPAVSSTRGRSPHKGLIPAVPSNKGMAQCLPACSTATFRARPALATWPEVENPQPCVPHHLLTLTFPSCTSCLQTYDTTFYFVSTHQNVSSTGVGSSAFFSHGYIPGCPAGAR